MDKKQFDDFFRPYSQNVDNANRQAFWKLSDALITKIIIDNIDIETSAEKTILDAGGGTGRWVCDLSKKYKTNFIVYDRSSDMLKKAKENISATKIESRVKLVEGDLTDMKEVDSDSIDHIISIYSPISFIYEKQKAFNEMFRTLKKGGKIIIMGHGFYNAVASKINNYCAKAEELKALNDTNMVKWGDSVPPLNTFSKEIMEKDLQEAGFVIIKTYGVPVFVQPGAEDFDPENVKKSRISTALENDIFFQQIFNLEMQYNGMSSLANRGMNIFTVAQKQ